MTWLYDSVLGPPSQIALIVTALGIHYLSSSCYKNKITGTISYRNKALMTFHHDTPNSNIPDITWYILFQWEVIIHS